MHEGLLLQAVRASWLAKKNRARIDDVVDFLKNARDNDQYVESPTIRSRLDEMIVLLDQYTAGGTYGRYFNSDEPSLRDDAKMVVLELGGLEDRPSLLVAVMFSLIIYIENRMYRTPRNLKKLNVIDEGWRLFARQGEVMNPLQYVPFNQTLYFINGDDPAQVAWMKRQTPPTLESKIILVQGSIPEMQKALDSRVYFDQNGVLCQRLGIDQVPARVSAVPGNRFLKVEFIPAEEGRK
ncbi:conjugal transfer protein TraU [Escherichia coli]|uniref:TraG/VirB4 family ATPase n=1 Tax=Escherichia coli TaxID=562 RepID=UPI001FCEC263|nr:conjugal transfer protein TraU [Escherichia coli]